MRGGNFTFLTCDAALWQAIAAVGLIVLAAGCQRQYWYQEGKTFDECKADHGTPAEAAALTRLESKGLCPKP